MARFVEREIRAYLDCGVLANGDDAAGREHMVWSDFESDQTDPAVWDVGAW